MTSVSLTIDATTPLSRHALPIIDLQPQRPDNVLSTPDVADVNTAYNDTSSNSTTANATMTTVLGYGGVGSGYDEYNGSPIDRWTDSDYVGTSSSMSFAFRGWEDTESFVNVVEFSLLEMGEEDGYKTEWRDAAGGVRPADYVDRASAASALPSAGFLRYLAASNELIGDFVPGSSITLDNAGGGRRLMKKNYNDTVNEWDTVPELSQSVGFGYLNVTPATRQYEPVTAGRLSNVLTYAGGRKLSNFAGTGFNASANITVSGVELEPGKVYGVALRVVSESQQITQIVSDGVLADSPRGVPCFGRIQTGPLSRRKEDGLVSGIMAGTVASGVPRPTPRPRTVADESSMFGSGSVNADVYYATSATGLELHWHHFADPYVQRPTALQRLYLCPNVDGYGSDLNSNYVTPGDVAPPESMTEPYHLALAPIEAYAIQLEPINNFSSDTSSDTTSSRRRLEIRGHVRALANAMDDEGSLLSETAPSLEVPMHRVGPTFLEASGPCCHEGYDRPDPMIPTVPADVELRPVDDGLQGFGNSVAVVAGGASGNMYTSGSYAVVGTTDGLLQVLPLHHTLGARLSQSLIANNSAARHVTVAASKAASGFDPTTVHVSAFSPLAMSAVDARVPAFAAATSSSIFIMEVRPLATALGSNSAICLPPNCSADTGLSFGDMETVAATERVRRLVTIRPNTTSVVAGTVGRAVAIFNNTVAFSAASTEALRRAIQTASPGEPILPVGARVVQVCENAFNPLRAMEKGPAAAAASWDDITCQSVASARAPIAVSGGIPSLPVPFVVSVAAESFGDAVALGGRSVAVAAPVRAVNPVTSDNVTILADTVTVVTSSFDAPGPDDATSADRGAIVHSALMRGLRASQPAGMGGNVSRVTLVDPTLVWSLTCAPSKSSSAPPTVNTGFGAALDMSADGRMLVVGAPGALGGRGALYGYHIAANGKPALACAYFGGLPDLSRLGESVSAVPITEYTLPSGVTAEGTIGLAAVSFYGLSAAPTANVPSRVIPAMVVLAIRAPGSDVPFQPSAAGTNSSALLRDLGVPACPIVAVIGSEASLDLRTQLGLLSPNANVSANAQSLLKERRASQAAIPQQRPRLSAAAGQSVVLLADASQFTWQPVNGTQSTGTGRLWATSFCNRNAARRKSSPQYAVLPFTCRACASGEASFGGVSPMCKSCRNGAGVCAGGVTSAGNPADTLLHVVDRNVSLVHGETYKIRVRAVTAAGVWLEKESGVLMVDTTPPVWNDTVKDGGYSISKCPDNSTECNTDVGYTTTTTQLGMWFSSSGDNETGVVKYEVGYSSVPCDGRLWRQCPVYRILMDALAGTYAEFTPSCSPLEVDYRKRWAARMGLSNWTLVGDENHTIPFNLDNSSAFDVAPLTDIELATTYTWDLARSPLPSGTYAFACAIAYNRAGLRSARSSDGVVIDTTPPVVTRGSVKDGFLGLPDYDSQAIVDGLAANWESLDYESGVRFHSWAYTLDPSPVLNAYEDLDYDGVQPDWSAIQSSINTTIVSWSAVPNIPSMRVSGLSLSSGTVWYALVRAQNNAGLWGNIEVSDGVSVGKAELKPEPGKGASLGFSAVSITSGATSLGKQRAELGSVVGSLYLPPDSVAPDRNITNATTSDHLPFTVVAGVVDGADLNGTGVANVTDPVLTAPPARNFVFGDYTFTIKTLGQDGKLLEGFRFAKPVLLTLAFKRPSYLPATAKWAPQLNLYNVDTRKWEPAVQSCPVADRFEEIDAINELYTVAICHLTQFGLYYQQAPVAAVNMTSISGPGSASRLSQRQVVTPNGDVVASSTLFATYTAYPGAALPLLDASASYDPDGPLTNVSWSLLDCPPARALYERVDRGQLEREVYDAWAQQMTSEYLSVSGPLGSKAEIRLPTAPIDSGEWALSVTVTDASGVNDTAMVVLQVNLPPTIYFSRTVYLPDSLMSTQMPAGTVADGSETSVSFNAALLLAGPDDVVLDASLSMDWDGTIVSYAWAIDYTLSTWDAGSSPAVLAIADGPVVRLMNAAKGRWFVRLTVTDDSGAVSTAVAYAGQPLKAVITNGTSLNVLSSIYTLDASATASVYPLSDLLFTWEMETSQPGVYQQLPVVPWPSIVVRGTTVGTHRFRVIVRDPAGRSSNATIVVTQHAPPVAVLSLKVPTSVTPWCGPAFQVELNASASYDPEGNRTSVSWAVSHEVLDVAATVANDEFAPLGAHPLFIPVNGTNGTVVRVYDRLPMGRGESFLVFPF